jgi:DNA-binding PadR family transcriptional regulator
LRVLKDAGLVSDRKAGTKRIYEANPAGIAALREHFDKLWEQALAAFQLNVERTKEAQDGRTGSSKGKQRPKNAKRKRSH